MCVVCGVHSGTENDYYANTSSVPCQYIFTNIPLSFTYLLPKLYIYIYVYTWKVLKCGAGEGWGRSVGPIM